MKVKELIRLLESEDPEASVHFQYPSHDYWGTVLASEVSGARDASIKWTEYHREYKLLDYYIDEDDRDEIKKVVLIY